MESTSILAAIASPFAVLLVPVVGFAAWQLAAAAITGFIANLLVIIGSAVRYIWKEKKKGSKCIGCPNSGCCPRKM